MDEPLLRENLTTTNFSDLATGVQLPPVTPGEVLRLEFMEPLELSARTLAREIGVPANRITAVLAGTRSVTAETALLLARRFGTSAEFWMNLQTAHDLDLARRAKGSAA